MGGGGEIRVLGLVAGEQQAGGGSALGPARDTTGSERGIAGTANAVDVERGKQGHRLDMAVAGGALQPADTLDLAARHARAFEIAAPDPVLGLGQSAAGGADIEGEGVGVLVPGREHGGPAQSRRRGEDGMDPIERFHEANAFVPAPWRPGEAGVGPLELASS